MNAAWIVPLVLLALCAVSTAVLIRAIAEHLSSPMSGKPPAAEDPDEWLRWMTTGGGGTH